jgi:hypothetical protein
MAATQVAQSGFVGWVLANGQIVLFFAQLIFWLVLAVAAGWAAVVFNRYVSFMMGATPVTKTVAKPAPKSDKSVSVDQFVE